MTQKTHLYRIHLYWTQMQHGDSGRPNRKTTALRLSKAKLGSVNNYSTFESSLWLATAIDWMPDNGSSGDYVTWTSHNDLGVIYRTTKSHIHRISFVIRRKLYMKDWAQNDQEGTDELHRDNPEFHDTCPHCVSKPLPQPISMASCCIPHDQLTEEEKTLDLHIYTVSSQILYMPHYIHIQGCPWKIVIREIPKQGRIVCSIIYHTLCMEGKIAWVTYLSWFMDSG